MGDALLDTRLLRRCAPTTARFTVALGVVCGRTKDIVCSSRHAVPRVGLSDTLATGSTRQVTEAVTAYEQLVDDNRRMLGDGHPDTLGVRANLAVWQGEGGDLVVAAIGIKELLLDLVRVLGSDDL
ncbi:hypothetical protein GCM10029964_070860 [Kibdelosporangium lantanae]